MLLKLTLDHALLVGALVIGPALMLGFVLLMSRVKRRALLRRRPHEWHSGDPALGAAIKLAAHLGVPRDRLRPQDRLVADLHLDHHEVAQLLDQVEDDRAAQAFLRGLSERTLADLGMLLAGVAA
jgi:hypothetical protein